MERKTLGPYRLEKLLGRGGMGEVYKAWDTRLERWVAIKHILPEAAERADRRSRFWREAKSVARLSHPAVIKLFDLLEEEDGLWIVMELVDGPTLAQMVRTAALPPATALSYARRMAEGIAAVHSQGIIHRDLKTENVMVTSADEVKILDFGLAKPIDPSDSITFRSTTGKIVGTIRAMAPEQAEGRMVDARSDLFSFGVLLYEILTGVSPFRASTAQATMLRIFTHEPPRVDELEPEVSSELADLVAWLLEKYPEHRPRNAQQVAETLAEIERGSTASTSREALLGLQETILGDDETVVGQPLTELSTNLQASGALRNDLFISYSSFDDVALAGDPAGWVSGLHEALALRLAQLLGKKPKVVRNPKIENQDLFDERAAREIPRAATLLSVLSPPYVSSPWCCQELSTFAGAHEESLQIGGRSRLFKLVKLPVPAERQPKMVRDLLPYDFYELDSEGRPLELSQQAGEEGRRRYFARLNDVAYDLCDALQTLETHGLGTGTTEGLVSQTGQTIFVAETTYEHREQREALVRDLREHGHHVLPDRPLPLQAEECVLYLRDQLERCMLSVHLMGANFGVVPEGTERSLVAIQNDLAAELGAARRGLRRLVWIPPGLAPQDQRQSELLAQVRHDPRLGQGADILETPFSDLQLTVRSILSRDADAEAPSVSSEHVPSVYLICDAADEEAARTVADLLFDRGYEVVLPLFEGDESEIREEHEESLRSCDAAVLYYGSVREVWLRRMQRELKKAAGYGREQPFRCTAIWVAPPHNPAKDRLRTHESLVVRQHGHEITATELTALLSALREGAS